MKCSTSNPGGANSKCVAFLSEVSAVIIAKAGSAQIANAAAADNIETFRVLLQESNDAALLEFEATTPTPGELTTETTGYGTNYITAESAPSMIGNLRSNSCDYIEVMSAYEGGIYDVFLFNADGKLMLTDKKTYLNGFQTQVYAKALAPVGRDAQTEVYQVTLNFLNYKEFRTPKFVGVNYDIEDLKEFIPLGLTAEINTDFDGNAIILDVYTRCSPTDIKTGVMTAEVVRGTQGLVITAVPTDSGGGKYTVVIQKDGPADLGVGEYAEFILVIKTGDVYDEISNTVKVTG